MIPNIVEIKPRWWHGYANSPDIEVFLDGDFKHEDFIYEKHDLTDNPDRHYWLISRNLFPWVRFLVVDDPLGRPQTHGALGGNYKLTDGTIHSTLTGWSSRPSKYNERFADHLNDEVTEVRVKMPGHSVFFAGYYINAQYLLQHDKFPTDLHLVHSRGQYTKELNWVISTDEHEVKKP